MKKQELKNLWDNLLQIISVMIIEDDEKEISNMQAQALKIISDKDFREHVNDNINGYTILDAINKCSGRVSQNYTEKKGLAEIEKAIKDAGGRTSEELGKSSSLDNSDNEEVQLTASPTATMQQILEAYSTAGVGSITSIGARLGTIFTSNGQTQRVGGIGTILGATLGGLLSVPIMFMLPASIASMRINRSSEHRVSTREVAQHFLDLVGESRIGLFATLGAGVTTSLLRSGLTPLTFRGGVTFSGVNMEFGESLRSGLVAAVGAGIGATLSIALIRRALVDRSVPANLENAAVEQPNIQPEQNR
ncbi:MAG: hypothetical protein ACR5K9_01240 [Wolbachia sp.]